MPRYSPIEIPVPLAASGSDLVAFRWDTGGVVADFLLPDDDERAIRMTFNKPCIIRILDEMPLSTENDSRSEGLVPDHFAYRVEGSAFVDAQSEAWMLVNAPVTHYRFITGWACMDVLSSGQPSFTVIERPSARSARSGCLRPRADHFRSALRKQPIPEPAGTSHSCHVWTFQTGHHGNPSNWSRPSHISSQGAFEPTKI
jgi:hypothetical protein